MPSFDAVPEQHEARRLLAAALAEGPAHAYLLHGPAGTGKRRAAFALAAALLGDPRRVNERAHPDLYVLEALGEMIRIDEIRELRRDLHMRPFEADRRVYLILNAHLLNADAADALLKDLEEPPPYAVIVLVADELGPLPPTIRSRCQLVPFRRLPERAVREWIVAEAPGLAPAEVTALARVAAGRLDRARRLLDPSAAGHRTALLAAADARGLKARDDEERKLEGQELTQRELEQRLKRAQRGAEREELLASLEELAAWYRDLVVVAAGAEGAVVHADRMEELRADASAARSEDAGRAAETVRAAWRALEELNLNPQLALEALFVRLRRELAAAL